MVATDGHRLAHIEKSEALEDVTEEIRVLIPKKAMTELVRMISEGGDNEHEPQRKEQQSAKNKHEHAKAHCGGGGKIPAGLGRRVSPLLPAHPDIRSGVPLFLRH